MRNIGKLLNPSQKVIHEDTECNKWHAWSLSTNLTFYRHWQSGFKKCLLWLWLKLFILVIINGLNGHQKGKKAERK